MKTTIGYGFRLDSESVEYVLKRYYNGTNLSSSLDIAKEEFNKAIKLEIIDKDSKPVYFKITMFAEDVEES